MVPRPPAKDTFLDTPTILLATAGAFLLAGFVKGVIGLGLPTVAIGLLGLVMTPAQAAAILVVPALIGNVWQCAVGGALLAVTRRLWGLLVGVCLGIFIGATWLAGSGAQETLWLGIALSAYAVLGLSNVHFTVPPRAETWLGLVTGTVTGIIAAGTGVFVIPAVPYLHALRFDRNALVQALGVFFTVSTVALAGALAHAGEMNTSIAVPSLVALATSLGGMIFGQVVRGRVKATTFRLCFFIGLLVLGAHLILRGMF